MNYKLLGRRIREQRTGQRISQEKLAEMVDISVTYMGAIENARKHPSLRTLVNIANALKTTPDFLLYGNLQHDTSQSRNELWQFFQNCSPDERYIILALAKCFRTSLQETNLLQEKMNPNRLA